MNKVFKVIWSEARNAYVVVSEIAKNHGSKSCSTKKLLTMLIATGVMTCASMAPAMAAPNSPNWQLSTENGAQTKIEKNATVNFSGKKDSPEHQNIKVTNEGTNVTFELDNKLENITSVGIGKSRVTLAPEIAGITNGTALMTIMNNSINVGTITGGTVQIHGVAAGTAENDAVNYGQLQATNTKVENLTVEAGKHTTLVAGDNVTLVEKKTDKGLEYTVTAKDTTYSAGENVAIDKDNKISVDLSKYAKTEDVAVVYDKNKTSLRSTNATGVAENAIALGKGAYAVKNSIAIGNGAYTQDGSLTKGQSVALGNGAVTGAKSTSIGSNAVGGREGTITIGANANNGSAYATVIGTDSKLMYKTKYSGAAATIVGAQSEIKNENDNQEYSGVANGIYGSANTIKNSNGVTIQGSGNTVTDAYKDMNIGFLDGLAILGGDYSVLAKKESGAVAVVGGANTVSKQTDSTVIGYDNQLIGDKEKGNHDVFMAGSHNRLNNVSDSLVMGNKNAITGVSNVISFGYQNAITANNAVAIGNGASVSAEGGVALGGGSVADRANAVSVGRTDAERQITNVAAGTYNTDAVNVSQLKQVEEVAANANKGWNLSTGKGEAVNVAPGETVDFSGDKNIKVSNTGKDVKVELNKDLQGIESVSNGSAKLALNGAAGIAGLINGKDASVFLMNDSTVINGIVGIDKNGKITGVADGKISADSKDAVNGSQLNAVATEAGKHTTLVAGDNVQVKEEKTDNGLKYTVSATDTTYTAGNGIAINGENNAISVNLKEGEVNLAVDEKGLSLNKDLKGIESISNGSAKLALNGAAGIAGLINGKDASVFLMNDSTVINGIVGIDKNGKITGVAAGTADTDAVNYGQLKNISAAATAAKTEIKGGTNIAKVDQTTADDGHMVYTVNADGTTVSGDSNVVVTAGEKDANNVTNYGVKLNKDLKGIESVSNGNAKLTLSSHPFFGTTAELTNGQASVSLMGGSTKINGKVEVRQDGTIGGVTAGRSDKDAVNVSQLNNVKAEALKHTTLSDGKNTTVESTVKDGQTDYKVNVAGDLTDITSVANGGAKLALDGATGTAGIINGKGASIFMMNDSTVINNVVGIDKNGKITGVAAGTADTDAVNVSQLKKVSDTANAGWTLSTNGNATAGTKVTPGALVDFSGDNNVSVSNEGTAVSVKLNNALKDIESISNGDAKLALNGAAGTAGIINGQGASVYMQGSTTVINSKVSVDKDGKISGVAAGKISADSTDAVNGSQLNAVATEAGKHSKVVNGNNTNVEETTVDGQKVYKVNLNNNIMVGDVAGKYVSISGTNGTIEATGAIATKDRVYADKGGKLADIDVTGNTISNGDAKLALNGAAGTAGIINGQGASVYMQGSTTVINSKVSFDQDGKISGVAAGVNNDDAVNVSQLKKVEEAAGNANKGWNLSTNGVATEATNVKPGDNVDFSGDKNIRVSNDGTAVSVKLNKNLKDIETISNGGATLTLGAMGGMVSEFTNGQGASVKLFGDTATINGKVTVYKDGRIAGVAAGTADTDAVNVSQLKKVSDTANAGWNLSTNGVATAATNVKPGDNVDFSGDKNISVSNDGTKVKVELNKNLKDIESISNGGASLTLGAMGGMVSEFTNGQGASVKLFGDTTTINGKVNVYKDGRIAGVADGVNANDAVNVSQLQKAAAASATTVSDGVNTTVTATKAEDGHTDYKVNLNKDLVGIESISNGDAKLTLGGIATELANGQGATVKLFGDTTTINNAVTVYKDGRISGVADGINNNDAVNVGQLNKVSEIANKGWNLATNGVATEATNVKPGDYVDFSGDKNISVSHDGTKVKVELNKDIDVNSVQTNALNSKYNLSVGTMAENGIMPFFVNSTGAFYAAHNKFSVDKDGNMNANSVQTNALNSKYNLSVGTANENGIVPFFVNSNGAFYAANNNFSVDKDGKVIATAGEIGNVVLNNGVYTSHSALRDGELFVGDASGNYSQITTKGAKLGKVTIAEDGKISGVAAGEVSSTSTDAINGSQLHQTNENVAALDKRVTQNEADIATNKANIAQNAADIAANKANIAQNAADIATNKANIAQNAADIAQNKADIAQNKADIAQNKADIAQNKTDIKNLDNRVTNVEELAKKHTTVTAGDNITVTEDTNKDGGKEYKVALDKDIKLDSVTTGQTVMNNDGLKVGKDVSVTATAVTAGKTSISDEGVKVGDKTYISDNGLNANNKVITNVADGKENSDAVNYGQLKGVENQVVSNTNRINQLGSRVNKVGAGAAALAALHPMDFDPDDKLTFSAGYGNYGGENAAAIGAYYRPDEKVMFSVGGTVGNGENMVNAGVSFSLDRTNHVSNSRTAMAREILDLRAEVTELKAMVAKGGLGSIAEDKMKIFPDVAENHWAYEYVGKLAAAGIIEGYPDGKFSGDRMMSRYEFAAMLYRAMQKGAQLDSKIINEFAPEMGRIRVDRISGEDGDRDKIERVRVNAVKGERDHYGNKIAKAEAKAK